MKQMIIKLANTSSNDTCPLVGRISPVRIEIVVVFPAPLGPNKPKHSPFLMPRQVSPTACLIYDGVCV